MEFHRTKNYRWVENILTHPDVYHRIGDDSLPPISEFEVYAHPGIWYVIASNPGLVGLFTLMPQNSICWELHVVMIGGVSATDKRQAAGGIIPWISRHTPCKRLTAAVPSNNKPAIAYGTHFLGMHYVGRQPKAFLKDGALQDLILLGRAVASTDSPNGLAASVHAVSR